MRINTYPTVDSINEDKLKGTIAIVFDVLRATTTIVTALANGCRYIIPVTEIDEAFSLQAADPENLLLGGERNAVKIPGFQLSNSPLEYQPDTISGKAIILTTTNGTRAIKAAAQAETVLMACLLNATAAAREAFAAGRDVTLVCAGTRGEFSLEDTLAAGFVIRELARLHGSSTDQAAPLSDQGIPVYAAEEPLTAQNDLILNDLSRAALRLAEIYQENPLNILYDSLHGQKLAQLGLTHDLHYCATLDFYRLVPVFLDGKIFPIEKISTAIKPEREETVEQFEDKDSYLTQAEQDLQEAQQMEHENLYVFACINYRKAVLNHLNALALCRGVKPADDLERLITLLNVPFALAGSIKYLNNIDCLSFDEKSPLPRVDKWKTAIVQEAVEKLLKWTTWQISLSDQTDDQQL